MEHSNAGHPAAHGRGPKEPRIIAWEITRSCNLSCVHCRASAQHGPYENELSTQECFDLVDEIASFSKPIIILTGGEPLMRPDIFEVAKKARSAGLTVVMAPNGTLLDDEMARKMVDAGISRISVSIDGATAASHDSFRKVPGAFDKAIAGIEAAKRAGIKFQINTTVTKLNKDDLPGILDLALKMDASAFHVFMLVPTGRGKELEEQELPPQEYEDTLNWVYDMQREKGIFFKPTDAPHYYRIIRERAKEEGTKVTRETYGLDALTRGCLGGITFGFISHVGDVQPCGYLEVKAGNVREKPFKEIWYESKLFNDLRDYSKLKGKCGICKFKAVCGGCRARAYERYGDYMAEEPYCVYEPGGDAIPASSES